MKNKVVRLFTTAVTTVPIAALLLAAGCGSGGGSSPVSSVLPVPTPTPSPSANVLSSTIPSTSTTEITVAANYDDAAKPFINVTFPESQTVPVENVVEYHIYRNDVVVARLQQAQVRLNPPPSGWRQFWVIPDPSRVYVVNYQTIGAFPTQLVNAHTTSAAPFAADTPIVYRVTLLYGSKDIEGQTNYTETEIGRSNTITPFR